jgi:hypothetical protein
MSTIEIFAVIFAGLTLAKIIVVVTNPKAWMNFVEPLYKNPMVTTVVFLILAVFTGYYVLQVVSVVEVAAVMLFLVFLIGIGMMPYSDMIWKMGNDMLKKGTGRFWLPLVIWAGFALWVLYTILLG